MFDTVLIALGIIGILLMFLPWPKFRAFVSVLITLAAALFSLVYFICFPAAARPLSLPGAPAGTDYLLLITLTIVLIVGCTASLYSSGYLKFSSREHPFSPSQHRRYYVLLMTFYAALLWAPLTLNLLWLWVLVEGTALATVFLIDFQQTRQTLEASWKYMVMMEIGGVTALLGTLFILAGEPSGFTAVTWPQLLQHAAAIPERWLKIGFVLLTVGYGLKAGLVPLHTWLPDAHSQAPSPISAMLSGIKINVALYALLRYADIMYAAGLGDFANTLLRSIGLLTVIVAVAMTTVQRDYKRLFAYSSTENMGLILLGYTLGPIGMMGAFLQMLNHALIKPGLFYLSGNLMLTHGSTDIGQVKGAVFSSPWTGRLLLLLMLAIAGAPPFGLFISEFLILLAAFHGGLFWLGIILTAFLALLFANFLRYALEMVFGRPSAPTEGEQVKGELGSWQTILPPLAHLFASLTMGVALPAVWQALIH
ncbi:proton-conducting transporter membrane subunit [Desulfosporosinus sp. PR]|uniref:proton-conducting transporter transmembrane domain-containing protein n=1 Tax=Candidatus Desulfosporosinus nitrosoreducens TaxID=3401928 RepID=UPI0027F897DF|nr:proton-conducting transporter membrane subunit [Desulfosporosinus sp. PR]MDQ7092348.1 proton-conducting transporter membrane subunit [Desulfosporosinus sp. PR]